MTTAGLNYRKEWSLKTGRDKADVYVPENVRTNWTAKRSDARFHGAVHFMFKGIVDYAEGYTTDDDPDVLDLVPDNAELFLKSELDELPPIDPERRYEQKVRENNPHIWAAYQDYVKQHFATEHLSFVDWVGYKYTFER